jgi:hypothetical protein
LARIKAPNISEVAFERFEEGNHLAFVTERFVRLNKAISAEEIPRSFIAFEVLDIIQRSKQNRIAVEDTLASLPGEWGDETVAVPLAVVNELGSLWRQYRASPEGTSLGSAMGLEGKKNQGSHKATSIMKTRERNFHLAYQTMTYYVLGSFSGNPVSLEKAAAAVSEARGISTKTIMTALKDYRKDVEALLHSQGLVEYPQEVREL